MVSIHRIEDAMTPEPNSGCWLWTGVISHQGYAIVNRKLVHRLVYERQVGPIPPKWVIDHLCRNRACVNVEHLEAVTHQVNIRRGSAPAIVTANTGICQRGHVGQLVPRGDHRVCRECSLAGKRAYAARNREKITEANRTYYQRNRERIIARASAYQIGYRKRRAEAR